MFFLHLLLLAFRGFSFAMWGPGSTEPKGLCACTCFPEACVSLTTGSVPALAADFSFWAHQETCNFPFVLFKFPYCPKGFGYIE